MPTCPDGHVTAATDFCDQCGLPVVADPPTTPAPAGEPTATEESTCPNCGANRPAGALFCESCGYDYTTGAMPDQDLHTALGLTSPEPTVVPDDHPEVEPDSSPPPDDAPVPTPAPPVISARHAPSVAEVWVDPQWYAFQESSDPLPAQGPPRIVVLRDSALIGRRSVSRQIMPDIDCEPDAGVSRRQAYLTSADGHWYVNDLDSANGTFVAAATAVLPAEPITARTEVTPGMRIYVGAWTRVVVRPAVASDLPPAQADSVEVQPDKENDGNQNWSAPDRP